MKRRSAWVVIVLSIGLASCKERVVAPSPVTVKVQALQNGDPVPGELRAVGRRDGLVVWNRSFALGTTLTSVQLPGEADSFDLRFDSGTANRTVRIGREPLRLHPELIVGLTDADYRRYTTADGNLTLALSRDPTNPYLEITVLDPAKINYAFLDRGFYLQGAPVANEEYRQLAVTEFDNTTFRSFARFRGQGGVAWDYAVSELSYSGTSHDQIAFEWCAPSTC